MPLIRESAGNYRRTTKKMQQSERHPDDVDLMFKSDEGGAVYRVYVLDENEIFDRKSSSNRDYYFYGPGVVTVTEVSGMVDTSEDYVNSPRVWRWISRCIAGGYLHSGNVTSPTEQIKEIPAKPKRKKASK